MYMKLECPCGKVLKVPEELKGKKARCPNCMLILDIPENPEPLTKTDVPSQEKNDPISPDNDPIMRCTAMVEEFLRGVGLNPDEKRLREKDTLGWWIKRGSAIIYIILSEKMGQPTIRTMSPIVFLPETNLTAFYRKCLEINLALMGCALGVVDNKVILLNERPIAHLNSEELQLMLDMLSGLADELDNKLADAFGCRLYNGE